MLRRLLRGVQHTAERNGILLRNDVRLHLRRRLYPVRRVVHGYVQRQSGVRAVLHRVPDGLDVH
jgi:hypothetical protein